MHSLCVPLYINKYYLYGGGSEHCGSFDSVSCEPRFPSHSEIVAFLRSLSCLADTPPAAWAHHIEYLMKNSL
jgi:hypothetical protein